MEFHVEDMTCGGCARSVTATIKNIDPNATVDIDVATKLVNVQSSVDEQKIKEALAEDGFPALNA